MSEEITFRMPNNRDLIQSDPYNSGRRMGVHLIIDPEDREVSVGTYSPGQGTPMRTWLGRDIHITIARPDGGEIDAEELIKRAEDPETTTGRLIREIMDGHTVEWDGSNTRGYLTDEARDALMALSERLDHARRCPATDWVRWEPEECYGQSTASELAFNLCFDRDTTDAEMREIAARETRLAAEAGIDLVEDDVGDYLIDARDRLIDACDLQPAFGHID
jgi:hypothetical protein